MASTITAGNATGGLGISSDNTGILELKTGTGTGATALTADASQNITMPGNLTVTGSITAGSGTVYSLNQYVAPATWTKPTGLRAVKVTVVGAGGNGSGAASSGFAAGGGGGGGGGTISFIPAPSIPGPVAVTAGPGTNSFGAFCSATAGANSVAATAPATGLLGSGGAGGTGSGGTLNFNGLPGAPTKEGTGNSIVGGGGSSILGIGNQTQGVSPTTNVSGTSGVGYGAGGGGTVRFVGGTTTASTGTPGIVIVEEFY